jgi:ADP-ribose pyrophosphatase YjhB (NUDIX family)
MKEKPVYRTGVYVLLLHKNLCYCQIMDSTIRLIGGGVENKESLIEALHREIEEETGVINFSFKSEKLILIQTHKEDKIFYREEINYSGKISYYYRYDLTKKECDFFTNKVIDDPAKLGQKIILKYENIEKIYQKYPFLKD